MNEFTMHVLKTIDRHEETIKRVIRSNKKTVFMIGLLTAFSIYQSIRISDLEFELTSVKKTVADIEESNREIID